MAVNSRHHCPCATAAPSIMPAGCRLSVVLTQKNRHASNAQASAAPIEQEAGPEDCLLPRPAPVLQVILADGLDRVPIVLPGNQEAPTGAVLGLVNGGLDPLADEHQAPVHRLAV